MTDGSRTLADRYGRPAPWRRTAVLVGSGILGLLAVTWLAWSTLFHASPEVSSEIVGWEVVDDHAITAQVDVVLRGDGEDLHATCQVRAIAADHTVVGEASFVPEDGRNEVEVRTERRATAVESVGCTTPDQRRPR
ncbi:MAG TPA: DUF4307 domain-containing protein [Nocardioides sp.]|nr:DUF4307 domain-containing protein [Nocardioides sp.]